MTYRYIGKYIFYSSLENHMRQACTQGLTQAILRLLQQHVASLKQLYKSTRGAPPLWDVFRAWSKYIWTNTVRCFHLPQALCKAGGWKQGLASRMLQGAVGCRGQRRLCLSSRHPGQFQGLVLALRPAVLLRFRLALHEIFLSLPGVIRDEKFLSCQNN